MNPTKSKSTYAQNRRSSSGGLVCGIAAAVYLSWSALAFAQGTVAPVPKFTGLTNAGVPCAGCFVDLYLAGTTTLTPSYTDVGLAVANTNPVVLDSAGRATIFLSPGTSYKFVLRDTSGATVWTQDNVVAVPSSAASIDVPAVPGENIAAGACAYLSDGSGGKTAGTWYQCATTNPYSSILPIVGVAPAAITYYPVTHVGTVRIGGQVTGLAGLTIGSSYYVGATPGVVTSTAPTVLTNQNVRRLVGVADSTTTMIVVANPPPLAARTIVNSALTGTQNDFTPGFIGDTVVRLSNATTLTITGFANGYDGQRITLISIGAGEVDFSHQAAGSAAANRLVNIATTGITPLAPGAGMAEYVYDGTTARWRLVSHEQGAWIAYVPTYGGNGAQTFTAVTTTTVRYRLSGRTAFVAFDFSGTVGGTPNTQVTATLPNSYTAAATTWGVYDRNLVGAAIFQSTAAAAAVSFWNDLTAAGNWGAGNDRILGTAAIEVN